MYENLTLVADLDAGMIGQYVWISMSTRGHMTKKTLEKQVQKRNGVHKTRSAQNYKETKNTSTVTLHIAKKEICAAANLSIKPPAFLKKLVRKEEGILKSY